MNIQERKNLTYRIVSAFLLLVSLGVTCFSLYSIIVLHSEEIILMLVAISVCALFALLEAIFILKGGKKESVLSKIAFNENGHINNVPLIAVGIGTAFGVGLLGLGISVFLIRDTAMIKSSMLVVMSIATYLLVNCLIYFFFLILFKNRPLDLRDLIK